MHPSPAESELGCSTHHVEAIQIQSFFFKANVAIEVGSGASEQGCMHFGGRLIPQQLLLAHLHQMDNVSLVRAGQFTTLQGIIAAAWGCLLEQDMPASVCAAAVGEGGRVGEGWENQQIITRALQKRAA